MCFLLCTYTLNVHTAISIQVVPEQSIKVEYERERLGIAKKLMNFLDSQQAFRARNRVPLCSGTTLIKIAVYVYIMYALYDQRTSSSLETSRSHTTFKAHFHSRKFSTDRKFSENIIVKSWKFSTSKFFSDGKFVSANHCPLKFFLIPGPGIHEIGNRRKLSVASNAHACSQLIAQGQTSGQGQTFVGHLSIYHIFFWKLPRCRCISAGYEIIRTTMHLNLKCISPNFFI